MRGPSLPGLPEVVFARLTPHARTSSSGPLSDQRPADPPRVEVELVEQKGVRVTTVRSCGSTDASGKGLTMNVTNT
jgi:hypothetical protein